VQLVPKEMLGVKEFKVKEVLLETLGQMGSLAKMEDQELLDRKATQEIQALLVFKD